MADLPEAQGTSLPEGVEGASAPTPAPLSWKATRAHLRQDRARLASVLAEMRGSEEARVGLHPSYVCVVLYRTARYHHLKGRSMLARLFSTLNFYVTGADISPAADLGAGLVIVSPPGTALYGKAGRNLTVMPCSGLGGELGRREDIGAGPGLPVVGDDVVLGAHCGALGPCRVGDRVWVAPLVLVTRDVPNDMIVEGPPARVRTRAESS